MLDLSHKGHRHNPSPSRGLYCPPPPPLSWGPGQFTWALCAQALFHTGHPQLPSLVLQRGNALWVTSSVRGRLRPSLGTACQGRSPGEWLDGHRRAGAWL